MLCGGKANWLPRSANAAAARVLLTLIAGVLLQLRPGKRRMIEAMQRLLPVLATPEEAAVLKADGGGNQPATEARRVTMPPRARYAAPCS